MKASLPKMHFAHPYLLQPTNPITVNLIGAGGTGSHMLTALARINHALCQLDHPGLHVTCYDDDTITAANIGRQLFAESEIGMYKTVALINRINRWFGSNWKAKTVKYTKAHCAPANMTISCVDTVAARYEIAEILRALGKANRQSRDTLMYWMDFGNAQHTGQVVLSTVGVIKQPKSKKYQPVNSLPFITDEFAQLLTADKDQDNTPSCSLAEALENQDLFVNSDLANGGGSLLWNFLREGMTEYKGFFMNLKDFRRTPIPVA